MKPNTTDTADIQFFLEALRRCLSPTDFVSGIDIPEAQLRDWSTQKPGAPLGLVMPRSTEEVCAVMVLCHHYKVPVVPQGGLTGLAGGAVASDGALLLSLARMSGIEDVDAASACATVLAGTPLQKIQEAAEAEGMMFGLDLGPRGSCQIGGNIATNAGGNRVIRYGMTRDLILGMEVVLADGTVLSMLNRMPKNNAALDLKPLFIGSEGTLGVITRAVVKLHPGISGANTALVALPNFESAIELLGHARQALSDRISAFELMWDDYFEAVLEVMDARSPLKTKTPLYALIDMQGPDPDAEKELFQAMLEEAMEQGWVIDAALAQSHKDAIDFWLLRDGVTELLMTCRPSINFDVSVPIAQIGRCVEQIRDVLEMKFPDMKRFFFGHVGDGNIHLVTGPLPEDPAVEHQIEKHVYDIVRRYSGSISAEHGIGLHKKSWLSYSRSPQELVLLRQLKQMLDPEGLLNPGKVL